MKNKTDKKPIILIIKIGTIITALIVLITILTNTIKIKNDIQAINGTIQGWNIDIQK